MKKNGFTLIETLVVIALLVALSVTIGLSFSNMMDKQRDNEQKDYEKTIEDAACMYAEKNNINGEYGVKVKTLIEEGLLNKNLINPETKEAIINYQENCITIKYEENERTCKYTLDKCAEYILPHVSNAEVSVTTESLTIKIVAEAGTNKIKKYYFSKDNGVTYEESMSDTYVFENLVDNTNYALKVKVSDTLNKESNIYSVEGQTEAIQTNWEIVDDGTFTVPKSGKYKIEMHGGGGRGGSSLKNTYTGKKYLGGDGGGSGEEYIMSLIKGSTYNITIGLGATSSRSATATKFGNLIVEGGGNGSDASKSMKGEYSDGSTGTSVGSLASGSSGGSTKGNYGDGGSGSTYNLKGEQIGPFSGNSGAVFITYLGEN